MKSGASAASQLDEQANKEEIYHYKTSPLVAACAAFVTELGGEEERNVTLCRATSQRKNHTAGAFVKKLYLHAAN